MAILSWQCRQDACRLQGDQLCEGSFFVWMIAILANQSRDESGAASTESLCSWFGLHLLARRNSDVGNGSATDRPSRADMTAASSTS